MSDLQKDLRQSFRIIRRRPGFAIVIILSIALGVGANTAIFSVANLLLIRPMPFPEDHELVRIRSLVTLPGKEPQRSSLSAFNVDALREQSELFENIGAWIYGTYNLVGGEIPLQVYGSMSSANTFDVMGVEPLLGRTISSEEDQPGSPSQVVVLSHSLWKGQFGGGEDVLGQTIRINDLPHTVIGVMPPHYEFPYMSKLWVPLGMQPGQQLRFQHVHHVIGRLKDDVEMTTAAEDLDVIAARLAEEYPDTHTHWSFGLETVREDLTQQALDVQAKDVLIPLMAGAGFLLLIACANVANMLLGRALEQSGEIAIRAALGVSRWRMIRQLLTQGLVLSLIGGLVGLVVAYWTFKPLATLSSTNETNVIFQQLQLDHRVLGFNLLVSVVAGILFSLVPALKMSRPNLQGILMEGARTTPNRVGSRLLKLTVVAEVALAMMLLVGSGLMLKSLRQLTNADVGFDSENLLVLNITLPEGRYPEHAQQVAYLQQLIETVEAVPGVVSAGTNTLFPLRPAAYLTRALPEGRPQDDPESLLITNHRVISPGLLETMRVPLLKGRFFNAHDQAESEPVVIVSEHFAKEAWPGEDPIGRRVRSVTRSGMRPWMRVVGVVGNVADNRDRATAWYAPFTQYSWPAEFLDVAVRTHGDPKDTLPSIRDAIWSLNADQAMANVMTSQELIAHQYWGQRSSTYLMSMFAILGLLLSVIGIYGIQSYSVLQQRNEMGLRMVFGARPTDVVWTTLRKGMVLSAVGLVVGILGAFILTRFLASLLHDVSSTDPATFGLMAVVILAVAFVANYFPSRRATGIDPVEIIRY